jgi:hypothetical protein
MSSTMLLCPLVNDVLDGYCWKMILQANRDRNELEYLKKQILKMKIDEILKILQRSKVFTPIILDPNSAGLWEYILYT